MPMTIKDIKKKKSDLEISFLKDLKQLEKEAEISINHVEVKIDRHDYDEREKARKADGKSKGLRGLRVLKGVLDVVISINIENDPRSVDCY